MSLFTAAPSPERSGPRRAVPPPQTEPEPVATELRVPLAAGDGHVLFRVGETTFAVAVSDVREITRAPRLTLLPGGGRAGYGLTVALVDVHGRSVPVVDLRTDTSRSGDVLLPVWRRHAGLVVDRVLTVSAEGDLVPETAEVPDTLPRWARGVLRPVDGGAPVVVVSLPDAEEIEAGEGTTSEPRLGQPLLDRDA